MKKLLKLCLSTAFVAYLIVAVDFTPFEMHFNLLDWDIKMIAKFFIFFLFTLLICRGVEFEQVITRKKTKS